MGSRFRKSDLMIESHWRSLAPETVPCHLLICFIRWFRTGKMSNCRTKNCNTVRQRNIKQVLDVDAEMDSDLCTWLNAVRTFFCFSSVCLQSKRILVFLGTTLLNLNELFFFGFSIGNQNYYRCSAILCLFCHFVWIISKYIITFTFF